MEYPNPRQALSFRLLLLFLLGLRQFVLASPSAGRLLSLGLLFGGVALRLGGLLRLLLLLRTCRLFALGLLLRGFWLGCRLR